MKVAFATSLFAENNFDEFMTMNFAEEKRISALQFYMNANLQADKNKIEKIRDLCRDKSMEILCHSPKMLGEASNDSSHCEALAALFYDAAPKYCVFHFDENCEIETMISDCEKLIDFGIVPCVENFYIDKTRRGLVANIEKYLAFFERISMRNLSVLPVLDFPRLFAEQFTDFSPIFLSELLVKKFAGKKIIIHAIDSASPKQERSDWCAVGSGIVGWADIFDYLKTQNVFVEYTVLEYENTCFIDESIEYLKKNK